MKIYIPYLQDLDTLEYDQPLGAFDSIEKCRQELARFALDTKIDLEHLSFEIQDFTLNENILVESSL